jgi:asparagine synthase (glutamine-hydrolysing)
MTLAAPSPSEQLRFGGIVPAGRDNGFDHGFVVLVDQENRFVPQEHRARVARRVAEVASDPVAWCDEGGIAVGTWNAEPWGGSLSVRNGPWVAVGFARIDDRAALVRRLRLDCEPDCDLALLLAFVIQCGIEDLRDVIGDFAVVLCDSTTGTTHMAADPFGVRRLYYAVTNSSIAIASHASLLTASPEDYEPAYLGRFLVIGDITSDLTPYRNVHAVIPGEVVHSTRGNLHRSQFWSALDFACDPQSARPDDAERFRALFSEAVLSRLDGPGPVWSQLSGGLDSSSVVAMVQRLRETARSSTTIAGAVTIVDSINREEQKYAEVVAGHCQVPTTVVENEGFWHDDGFPPPRIDIPFPGYPVWARDRRVRDVVRSNGGSIVLSGHGADHYLAPQPHYFADWLAKGRLRKTVRALLEWSVIERSSFWALARTYAIAPMLPPWMREHIDKDCRVPKWIPTATARRYDIVGWLPSVRAFRNARPHYYASMIAYHLSQLSTAGDQGLIANAFQMRYPFLHRPLVEFCLRLPPELRTRARAMKWIQREAMRGILPEPIRTRTGKGECNRVYHSLVRQREMLDQLLRAPLLADLGLIDARALREVVLAATHDQPALLGESIAALALETWLRVRAGRWRVREGTGN